MKQHLNGFPIEKGTDMNKLQIAENKRYFVKENKEPFIWLADTVWTMPQRMKFDDVEFYLQTRKSQGFTVLQLVALDPERDLEMRNPVGVKALLDDDPTKPVEAYFEYLDWVIDKAWEYGFYILLLPVWGQLVVGDGWGGETYEKTVTEKNAYFIGEWIGRRYQDKENILWCLGGDRQPIHKGTDYRNVWRRMAEGLAKGVTGMELKYNEDSPYWEELLITYHTCYEMETGKCSTMSYWTDNEKWIRFIMLQSGHGLKTPNYEFVKLEYERENRMPVWDGEPAYEMMPTQWPIVDNFHGDWMVRKRAYWSLLSGSFGHTYGHASVWCSISEKEKDKIAKYSWYEALEQKGALQMKIVRDFMESMKLYDCIPCEEAVVSVTGEKKVDEHIQACLHKDKKYLLVYLPYGGTQKIRGDVLNKDSAYVWWFNPKDGNCYTNQNEIATSALCIETNGREVEVTAPTFGAEEDWILILETEPGEMPVTARSYGPVREKKASSKVFEW